MATDGIWLPESFPDSFEDRLVIFGAGGLGKKIAGALRRLGCRPLAFCDNNRALWNTEAEGLKILPPARAVEDFPEAVFLVAIWHPSRTEGIRHHIAELRRLGCREATCFIPLFWKYPDLFLPNMFWEVPARLADQRPSMDAARELFDDDGKAEFDRQLRLHLLGDFLSLREPEPGPQYFPAGVIAISEDETFVDCGAYDGDTIRDFLQVSGGRFRRIIALEPDPENFRKLAGSVAGGRILLKPLAAGAQNAMLRIASSGASSALSEAGTAPVQCTTLDELLAGERPTMIKMDIEGSEVDALRGATETIRRCRPRLAVCVYHRPDHLWRIPMLLSELAPGSRLTLRSHRFDGYDTVCYCLPNT